MLKTAVDYAIRQNARNLLLGVYAGNKNAIGFYRHMGFEQAGARRFNVGGVDYDDLILGKELASNN